MAKISQTLKTYDELIELLYMLDKGIERRYPDSDISVKLEVVGGFSLMYHGLRIDDQTSRDVDTYNELSSWVWKLAYDIDPTNWLNDGPSNVKDRILDIVKDNIEFVKDAKYRFPYDHLELWIATLSSVLWMKLDLLKRKADSGHTMISLLAERPRDISDIKEILSAFKINSLDSLFKEYPDLAIFKEYRYNEDGKAVDIFNKFQLFEGNDNG